MPTSYTPNIPQPSDIPAQSQDQILQNFQTINTFYGVNHVPLTNGTAAADAGIHTFVNMKPQTSDPSTAQGGAVYTKTDGNLYFKSLSGSVTNLTAASPTQNYVTLVNGSAPSAEANKMKLYTAIVSGAQELFATKGATAVVQQVTSPGYSYTGSSRTDTNYYILPTQTGGKNILVQWGSIKMPSSAEVDVTFAKSFSTTPVILATIRGSLTSNSNFRTVQTWGATTSVFKIWVDSNPGGLDMFIDWLAIGRLNP